MGAGPLPGGTTPRVRIFSLAPTEASDPMDQINPAIDQNSTIVWQDYRNGNWDIYAFDGALIIQVTTDPAAQERPNISNQTIVWQDYRSGDWDIYYNISGEETGLILPGEQVNPRISGNRIVF